jgi:hypothetical protein
LRKKNKTNEENVKGKIEKAKKKNVKDKNKKTWTPEETEKEDPKWMDKEFYSRNIHAENQKKNIIDYPFAQFTYTRPDDIHADKADLEDDDASYDPSFAAAKKKKKRDWEKQEEVENEVQSTQTVKNRERKKTEYGEEFFEKGGIDQEQSLSKEKTQSGKRRKIEVSKKKSKNSNSKEKNSHVQRRKKTEVANNLYFSY